jgi:hypothetical protein
MITPMVRYEMVMVMMTFEKNLATREHVSVRIHYRRCTIVIVLLPLACMRSLSEGVVLDWI